MRFHRIRTTQALGRSTILVAALAIAACTDPVCPSGTTERMDRCIRNSELADAEVASAGEQASTGSAGTSAGAAALAGAGTSSAGAGSAASNPVDPTIQWMCMKNMAGECTSCKQDADCPSQVCEQGYCMDCRDSKQCAAAESCISNRCVPERKPSSIWQVSGGGQTNTAGLKLQLSVGMPTPATSTATGGFKMSVAPGAGNF